MQHLVSFLYNSHVANVRKAVNDMFVVDPDMVNIKDVKSPSPGKVIRLRRKAWGRDVKSAIQQLQVNDITRQNIQEAAIVAGLSDQVTGTTDFIKGNLRRGSERISASEFNTTSQAALSRLEKIARIISIMGMEPLGHIIASHTQQFMTKESYVKIAGRYEEQLRSILAVGPDVERITADPMAMLVDYDVLISDGSQPHAGDPQDWLQVMQLMGAYPQLAQGFDITRIFRHWARLSGARNLDDFIVGGASPNISVLPDEDVAAGVEAGNVVPIEELTGVAG